MSTPQVGMMVTPNVRLMRPLSEGGMGAVWVAEHLALRTQVVVKFITGALAANPEALSRFEREAAAASQVKSPHVVQTFDHGCTPDGLPYIVMELLEGEDLGDYLDKHRRMPPPLVLSLVSQLSRALDRAHSKGIVHRDIKPNNIFLSEGESGEFFVKLLDFGIAKGVDSVTLDSATRTGTVMGSPYYMSPEQIVGAKDIGPRSDLWAVGVVVFEALTGVRPFDADTVGALALQIHGGDLPRPTEKNPTLPETVDAWFERACAREIDARFGSARELSEGLAAALEGRPLPSLARMSAPVSSSSGGGARLSSPSAPSPSGPALDTALSSSAMFAKTHEAAGPFSSSASASSSQGLAASRVTSPRPKNAALVAGGAFMALLVAGVAVVALRAPPSVASGPAPTPPLSASAAPSASSSAAVALLPLTATTASQAAPPNSTSAPTPAKSLGGKPAPRASASAPPTATPTASAPPTRPTATSNDPLL